MPKVTSPAPAAAVAAYDSLVATRPDVERKGAKLPYTALNGNMSSYLDETGRLVLRLSGPDREAFIARYETRLHEAYGTVQKEYVDVPAALLEDTAAVAPWFARSVDYVAGLRPKPTSRRTAGT